MLWLTILVLLTGCAALAANPVSDMYQREIDLVKSDVLSLARAMPADKYHFVPAGGAVGGVRSFGEQIKHLATMIYMTAAVGLQQRSPYGPGPNNNGPVEVQSKDDIIRYVEDAFAYARQAVASLTVENHLEPVDSVFGPMPRAAVFSGIAYHSYNHYGQMVVYARLNGVVPPNSVPSAPASSPR